VAAIACCAGFGAGWLIGPGRCATVVPEAAHRSEPKRAIDPDDLASLNGWYQRMMTALTDEERTRARDRTLNALEKIETEPVMLRAIAWSKENYIDVGSVGSVYSNHIPETTRPKAEIASRYEKHRYFLKEGWAHRLPYSTTWVVEMAELGL
jgi:hypothetical protein